MEHETLNLIMLGRSGSGKGTQAKLLVEEFNLEYLGTGDLLRTFTERGNPAAIKLKETLMAGKLVPSWFAFFVWMEKLAYTNIHKGVFFDGSPRKIEEAMILDEVLTWFGRVNVKVILLDITRDEAYHRLINRRVCSLCGKGAYAQDSEARCKYCHGELTTRLEDGPEAINVRLDWFDEQVVPVIEHYEQKGDLIRVGSMRRPEEVHQEILKKLSVQGVHGNG